MTRFQNKPIKSVYNISPKLDYECDYSFLNQFFRDGVVYAAMDEKFSDMFVNFLDLSNEEIAHLNPATYLNERVQREILNLLSLVGEVSKDTDRAAEYKSSINNYGIAISFILGIVHGKGFADEADNNAIYRVFQEMFRKVKEAVMFALETGDARTKNHKFLSKICPKE